MSDTDDPAEITVETVEDPDSYIQQRRLKDIFQARKEVRNQRQKAKEYQIKATGAKDEGYHRMKALRLYRAAVENYLSELRPLLLSDDLGTEYWFKLDLGSVTAEPPVYRDAFGDGPEQWVYHDGGKRYTVERKPETKEIDFTGFKMLFELADPLTVQFTLSVDAPGFGRGTTTKTVTERQNIPFRKLDAVMNEANHYLQQRGIELEADSTDEWEI